ncbi:methionyl-tRNA formyltransferase [Moritella sp. PE36]|nr:methionyl-tRNA formyltransferase [Moritella sp. PE36]
MLLDSQYSVLVVLNEQGDSDCMQLEQQLHHMNVPAIRYQTNQPELVVYQIKSRQADLGLIYTFSHKLPAVVLNAFDGGLFNLHASALPQYRGSMPLYWQIRNRETESYLSIIKVEDEFDTGDIMLQQIMTLSPLDTLNSVAHTLAQQAPQFIQDFMTRYANDELTAVAQQGEASNARMPTQKDMLINWKTMKSEEIAAAARAGNPLFNGMTIIWKQSYMGLLQATSIEHPNYGVPAGTVLHIGEPEGVVVATLDGALRLDVLTIAEGVFSGLAFAERFGLDAGMQFELISEQG